LEEDGRTPDWAKPRTRTQEFYRRCQGESRQFLDLDPSAQVLVHSSQQAPPPFCPARGPDRRVFLVMRRLSALVLVLLAGCSASTTTTATTSSSPAAPSLGSSATAPPPTAIPNATSRACLAQPGRIVVEEVTAEEMPRSLPVRVYLPPCYEDQGRQDYPVLILIHGLQSTDSQWDDLGVNETADALIRDGELAPTVIAMPWERKGLDFEAAVVEVLLPYIRATYAGGSQPEPAAIGGLSRGAGWALRIGLKHPELFRAIGLHSPAVLPPDMFYLADWVAQARQTAQMPRLWIDVAERDTSRVGAQELAELLDDLGLSYAWSSRAGEHTAAYWSSRMADYLRWYGELWLREAEMMGMTAP